jgi:ankyrin repeat protein
LTTEKDILSCAAKILASGGRLKENSDVNKKDINERTALMEAAKFGNADTVKVLVDEFAEVGHQDIQGRSALMEAASKGNPASTKLLVDRINKYDMPEIRSKLINAKDDQGKTALMEAISSGNKNTVLELLKSKDIDLSVPDNDGKTAVMIAQEIRKKATTSDAQKAADEVLQALTAKVKGK